MQNVGREAHTFTPVKHFGGGFIALLNDLTGNSLAAVTDADGIARVECCIHPWMRAEVRVK